MCHAACKSFGALLAVRFLLGVCEGAITPGFMIVTAMFYTRQEQTKRVGYWCKFADSVTSEILIGLSCAVLMNGAALIVLGFISYGVVHTKSHNFLPWQW